MPYIDFKTTCWERIKINDNVPEFAKEILLKAIKNGDVNSANGCFGIHPNIDDSFETLLDTSEQMSVEDNDGQSTIEIYDDENEIIWNNTLKNDNKD